MVVKTVASLRESCKKMGIRGYSGLKKAQLMRKCGSPKKKSPKKKSTKKYPSLPQFTPPPMPKKMALPQFTPPPMPKKMALPQFTPPPMPKKMALPQFTPPPMPKKSDLGSKVPWVFPDDQDDDEDLPPSYDSVGLAFGFSGVQKRCPNTLVSKCHRKSRICSKNTAITRCRLSVAKRRSRARASSRRSYRKHH